MVGNRNINKGIRFPAKKEKSFVILFAAGFCLIVIIVSFFPMTRSIEDDAYIKTLEKRIADLESQLAGVKITPELMRKLKVQSTKMETYANNYNRLDASIKLKTNLLADRMDKMQTQINGKVKSDKGAARFEKSRVHSMSTYPQKISNVKKTDRIRKKRKKVHSTNRVELHIVKKGETFYSISRKYGISLIKLKKLNGFTEKTIIYPGQKIVLK